MAYLTDTHGLVWHMTEDQRLGEKAAKTFQKADEGVEKVLHKLKNSTNYVVFDLNFEVIEAVTEIREIPGLHDRIIAATAKVTDSDIITKDPEIEEEMQTIWD